MCEAIKTHRTSVHIADVKDDSRIAVGNHPIYMDRWLISMRSGTDLRYAWTGTQWRLTSIAIPSDTMMYPDLDEAVKEAEEIARRMGAEIP